MHTDTRTLADYEQSIGIDSLDALHARRTALGKEYADLWALFGPPGLFDNKRKAACSFYALQIREAARENGQKVTEAAIEQAAHADKRYQDLLEEGIAGAARYMLLRLELDGIEERIARGQAVVRYAAAEARLQ